MHRTRTESALKDPVQIQYRDFYDFPRMFVAVYQGTQYLFDGSFDDNLDEYPDEYRVFMLPWLTAEQLSTSWKSLPEKATRVVGQVATSDVSFDPTKRQWIDAAVFDRLAGPR